MLPVPVIVAKMPSALRAFFRHWLPPDLEASIAMFRAPDVAPQFQPGGENGLSHSFRWRELCGWAGEHRLPHLRASRNRHFLVPFEEAVRIAVIIPAYNNAHYLRECLDSVLGQTCPVSEVIVVDDGSLDNTREVVESYPGPVRYFRQENAGAPSARNAGVRQTSSPWIAFLDADDRWDPRKIELQVKALEANPGAILCYTAVRLFSAEGDGGVLRATPVDRLWPAMRYANGIALSTVMMRRDAFAAAGGFDEKLPPCEDWDLWFRLGPGCPMAAVEEPVTLYRLTPTSISRNIDLMLSAVNRMLATSLLKDLRGWERWSWRRRAWSAELSRSAITARETGDPRALSLLLRSLATWPSPWFLPKRWQSLPVYLLRGREGKRRQGGSAPCAH
jgi:hypothetical protein